MCSAENHLHFDYVRLAWDTGFCFNESKSKIAFDISSLNLVDVERVTRDRDIATVVKYIPTILQFQLDEELSRILEPSFVKIFQLCQLSIQYLQFCKVYLDNTVVLLKRDHVDLSNDNEELQKCVTELKEENMLLQKQNLDLEKALNTANTVTFKCDECPKVFYSEEYLKAHIKRRHENSELQSESEKLQLEIKELKQRLNNTEKHVISVSKNELILPEKEPNNDSVFRTEEQIQNKFEQLKDYINKELGSLKDENFYSKIYEKCFSEMFAKFQGPKKTYVEQGAGDSIELRESSTQTNIVDQSCNKIEYKEFEDKLNLQKEQLENVLEKKISGTINRLEMQMDFFKNKLNDLEETKTLDAYVKQQQQQINELEVFSKLQQLKLLELEEKKNSPYNKSRLVRGGNNTISKITLSESDTEKEDEIIVIKPYKATKTTYEEKCEPTLVRKEPTFSPAHNEQNYSKRNSKIEAEDEHSEKQAPDVVIKNVKFSPKHIQNESPEKRGTNFVKKDSNFSPKHIQTEYAEKQAPNIVKQDSKLTSKRIQNEQTEKLKIATDKLNVDPINVSRNEIIDVCTDETSDDERLLEQDQQIVVKTPTTASTIGRRALSSLKEAAEDPELLKGFRNELQDVIGLKMKNLGVAPQWNGLPRKTFEKVLSIVKHQATLNKKNIPNYAKVRESILSELNKTIKSNKSHINESPGNSTDDVSDFTSDNEGVPKGALKVRRDQAMNKKKVIFNLKSGKDSSTEESASVSDGNRVETFVSESKENLNNYVQHVSDLELSDV